MERLDDICIIAPGPGDAAGLANVHVASWRETYGGLLPDDYLNRMSPQLFERRFRRQLTTAADSRFVLAAEAREGLVGYCAGGLPAGGLSAEISTLYVLRDAQNRGLGRRLLSAAAKVLRARGAMDLRLWVLNGNAAACAFYTHLGGQAGPDRPVQGWGGGFRETEFLWPDIRRLDEARA